MPSYDIDRYRSLFPYLKKGMIYLDHASVGPISTPVKKALEEYLQKKSETDINIYADFLRTVAATKDQIGVLLNCEKDRVAFTDNTTNGLNILAAGFPWKSGDRILLTDVEFPANIYPFLNQKRHGVEIDILRSDNGRILPEDVERAITPKTRILSISHVQFLHGFRADLEAIGQVCRRKGVVFCVDAIQSAGVVPIDMKSMNIDFLSSGCQKWLLSPEGTAFVAVSEQTQERIQQAYLGWTSIRDFFTDFFRHRLDIDPTARRYENGTLNFSGIIGLHASLSLILEVGIANIEKYLRELTQGTIEQLRDMPVKLLTPDEGSSRAGIVTFRPENAQALFDRLKARKIFVSLREGCIRFSPHFYNTADEISSAIDHSFHLQKT